MDFDRDHRRIWRRTATRSSKAPYRPTLCDEIVAEIRRLEREGVARR